MIQRNYRRGDGERGCALLAIGFLVIVVACMLGLLIWAALKIFGG